MRYVGRFSGATSLGDFRMPFEIVAPTAPGRGNGVLLLEPPHFTFGTVGRDVVIGPDLLFGAGFAYATVGFGTNGGNILDASAADARIAGAGVAAPGALDPFGIVDEEILLQFAHSLMSTTFGIGAVGPVKRLYGYGTSQTAAALLEALHHPQGRGLFDLTLLHVALWRPPFQPPGVFDRLDGEFQPPSGVGKVCSSSPRQTSS